MKQKIDKIEHFNPRNCIASKIMKANRIINSIFREHLKQLGLSNSQMSILFVLSKRKQITQSELSSFLYLEKSTVNRNIQRLVSNGWLTKENFPLIEITNEGYAMVESIIPYWEKAMAEAKKRLGKEGMESLDIILQNLTSSC